MMKQWNQVKEWTVGTSVKVWNWTKGQYESLDVKGASAQVWEKTKQYASTLKPTALHARGVALKDKAVGVWAASEVIMVKAVYKMGKRYTEGFYYGSGGSFKDEDGQYKVFINTEMCDFAWSQLIVQTNVPQDFTKQHIERFMFDLGYIVVGLSVASRLQEATTEVLLHHVLLSNKDFYQAHAVQYAMFMALLEQLSKEAK